MSTPKTPEELADDYVNEEFTSKDGTKWMPTRDRDDFLAGVYTRDEEVANIGLERDWAIRQRDQLRALLLEVVQGYEGSEMDWVGWRERIDATDIWPQAPDGEGSGK